LRKNNWLAFRETFFVGRLGIRGKILIYLAILAGFMLSLIWLFRSALLLETYQGILITVMMLLATGIVGFTMARSISDPIIETNRAALELSRARYTRPPHSGGYLEIAELNDTLVKAAEDLHRVEDLQQELIANISHDLRTPLTMIVGYAEAMRDIPDEMTPENMQIIIDESNRLTSMVNEVMEFSRMRQGAFELNQTDFPLTELIREIGDRVSRMTAVEGYTVTVDAAEEYLAHGDRNRISQVIYNLIGNALTYTGEDRTVRVTQRLQGGNVRICISDSGEGIPQDELTSIWDRYYRSRENHRRSVIGSGLGLNICRSILEMHQVPYGVESQLGKGSTFWFELPRAKEAQETPPMAGTA
jgi:signal transduction histidine kinase